MTTRTTMMIIIKLVLFLALLLLLLDLVPQQYTLKPIFLLAMSILLALTIVVRAVMLINPNIGTILESCVAQTQTIPFLRHSILLHHLLVALLLLNLLPNLLPLKPNLLWISHLLYDPDITVPTRIRQSWSLSSDVLLLILLKTMLFLQDAKWSVVEAMTSTTGLLRENTDVLANLTDRDTPVSNMIAIIAIITAAVVNTAHLLVKSIPHPHLLLVTTTPVLTGIETRKCLPLLIVTVQAKTKIQRHLRHLLVAKTGILTQLIVLT